MCDPTEPFDLPDLPDEAVIAVEAFLEEFFTRFQSHYFAQMRRATTKIVPMRPQASSR